MNITLKSVATITGFFFQHAGNEQVTSPLMPSLKESEIILRVSEWGHDTKRFILQSASLTNY